MDEFRPAGIGLDEGVISYNCLFARTEVEGSLLRVYEVKASRPFLNGAVFDDRARSVVIGIRAPILQRRSEHPCFRLEVMITSKPDTLGLGIALVLSPASHHSIPAEVNVRNHYIVVLVVTGHEEPLPTIPNKAVIEREVLGVPTINTIRSTRNLQVANCDPGGHS